MTFVFLGAKHFKGSTEAAGIWAIQSGISPKTPPASTRTPKPDSAQSAPVTTSDSITASGAASFFIAPQLGRWSIAIGHHGFDP
jgi:hypothetical protein